MNLARASSGALGLLLFGFTINANAHPLRLSLSQIEYKAAEQSLSISLRLFLTDVNEALVFDPYSTQLSFCQANEAPEAESLLLEYLANYRAEHLNSLEIKNAIFTDLFFDQSNIVYVYINGNPTSLMLNKATPVHTLDF